MNASSGKRKIFRIISQGIIYALVFSLVYPPQALASRSRAGGGKISKPDWGDVAKNVGTTVGIAVCGAYLTSAIGSAWKDANPSIIPTTSSASSSAAQSTNLLTKSAQFFTDIPNNIGGAIRTTGQLISDPMKYAKDGFIAFKNTEQIADIVIKGYSTYTAGVQVARAIQMAGAYYEWSPKKTYWISQVGIGMTAGAINPQAALGDTYTRTAAPMIAGPIVGGLGGFMAGWIITAKDGDRLEKGESPGIEGQLLGTAGHIYGTYLGRTLVDYNTYNTVWGDYNKKPAYDFKDPKAARTTYVRDAEFDHTYGGECYRREGSEGLEIISTNNPEELKEFQQLEPGMNITSLQELQRTPNLKVGLDNGGVVVTQGTRIGEGEYWVRDGAVDPAKNIDRKYNFDKPQQTKVYVLDNELGKDVYALRDNDRGGFDPNDTITPERLQELKTTSGVRVMDNGGTLEVSWANTGTERVGYVLDNELGEGVHARRNNDGGGFDPNDTISPKRLQELKTTPGVRVGDNGGSLDITYSNPAVSFKTGPGGGRVVFDDDYMDGLTGRNTIENNLIGRGDLGMHEGGISVTDAAEISRRSEELKLGYSLDNTTPEQRMFLSNIRTGKDFATLSMPTGQTPNAGQLAGRILLSPFVQTLNDWPMLATKAIALSVIKKNDGRWVPLTSELIYSTALPLLDNAATVWGLKIDIDKKLGYYSELEYQQGKLWEMAQAQRAFRGLDKSDEVKNGVAPINLTPIKEGEKIIGYEDKEHNKFTCEEITALKYRNLVTEIKTGDNAGGLEVFRPTIYNDNKQSSNEYNPDIVSALKKLGIEYSSGTIAPPHVAPDELTKNFTTDQKWAVWKEYKERREEKTLNNQELTSDDRMKILSIPIVETARAAGGSNLEILGRLGGSRSDVFFETARQVFTKELPIAYISGYIQSELGAKIKDDQMSESLNAVLITAAVRGMVWDISNNYRIGREIKNMMRDNSDPREIIAQLDPSAKVDILSLRARGLLPKPDLRTFNIPGDLREYYQGDKKLEPEKVAELQSKINQVAKIYNIPQDQVDISNVEPAKVIDTINKYSKTEKGEDRLKVDYTESGRIKITMLDTQGVSGKTYEYVPEYELGEGVVAGIDKETGGLNPNDTLTPDRLKFLMNGTKDLLSDLQATSLRASGMLQLDAQGAYRLGPGMKVMPVEVESGGGAIKITMANKNGVPQTKEYVPEYELGEGVFVLRDNQTGELNINDRMTVEKSEQLKNMYTLVKSNGRDQYGSLQVETWKAFVLKDEFGNRQVKMMSQDEAEKYRKEDYATYKGEIRPIGEYTSPVPGMTLIVSHDIAKTPGLMGATVLGSLSQGSFEFGWQSLAMGLPLTPQGKMSAYTWANYVWDSNTSLYNLTMSAARSGIFNMMQQYATGAGQDITGRNVMTTLANTPLGGALGMAPFVPVVGYKGMPFSMAVKIESGYRDVTTAFYPYWPYQRLNIMSHDSFWRSIKTGISYKLSGQSVLPNLYRPEPGVNGVNNQEK